VLLEGERHDVDGLPTTIIINSAGTSCEQHVGFTRRSTVGEAINQLL